MRCESRMGLAFIFCLWSLSGTGDAADENASTGAALFKQTVKFQYRLGMEVTARNGPCANLVCTFPIPIQWPEQKTTIIARDVSANVRRTLTRTLGDGVQQFEFQAPRLATGQTARAILTLEVERSFVPAPDHPEELTFPRGPTTKLRRFLSGSPFIETTHVKVKAAARDIQLDADATPWKQVETIYDWTRDRVKPSGVKPLKGALQALVTGTGDCEEITSLFVAMCRLKGIPARSVWVLGHAYPEFYLEDKSGKGLWIPCESLGPRSFGTMRSHRLIMQKGDNFRMTQKRGPQRYVTPTVSGTLVRGGGQPVLKEIREKLPSRETP
ncbi:MAG: transglutaminase-like domain-containing protein [Planctomycetales bacterium]